MLYYYLGSPSFIAPSPCQTHKNQGTLIEVAERGVGMSHWCRERSRLVSSGSLSHLMYLDRLEKVSSGGQIGGQSLLCERTLHRRQCSTFPVPPTPHLRAGPTSLLTFTMSAGSASSVPRSIHGCDVLGGARPISLATLASRGRHGLHAAQDGCECGPTQNHKFT